MENKQRNSNLELLRIICMLMIIAHHYVLHGDLTFSLANNMYATIYLKTISMFGKAAYSIFALITGYFMIEVATINKFYRRIVPLLFKMLFCSMIVFVFVSLCDKTFDVSFLVKSILNLFYTDTWYVKTYVCFFFFIPYINRLLKSLDLIAYKKLLVVIYIVYFVVNTLVFNRFSFEYLYFMFVMYAFGAYYRLYGNIETNNSRNLLQAVICFVIMIASSIGIVYLAYRLKNVTFLYEDNPLASYSNIISFGLAYSFFKYCVNRPFNNKYVNSVASTVLTIYLMHDNSYLYKFIWLKWFPNANYVNNPYMHSIVKISLIFIVFMLLDFFRQEAIHPFFEDKVYPYVNSKIDIINNKIENKINEEKS